MQEYTADCIRNVALVAHQGTGKTTLVEAALYDSGATTRRGRVEEGNTVSDWDPDEMNHNISINTSVVPVEWKGCKINFIDTPGYADFLGEVKEGLRVADAALLLVSAVDGLQVGTEIAWQLADDRGLARMVFVNKVERENADFGRVLSQLQERYGTMIAPVEVPIGREHEFGGVVDVLLNKAYTYEDGKPKEVSVPGDLQEQVDEYRRLLVEAVVETDDDLMNKYLEEEEISDAELTAALHRAAARGQIVPVMLGSASSNVGVTRLLDAIVSYMPNPTERDETNVAGDLSAIVFKTIADPYVGKLSYFRVYSGSMRNDSVVFNVNQGRDEHIGPVLVVRGKAQEHVAQVSAGDIGAVAKLHDTHTGDTLSVKGKSALDGIDFPSPAFSASVIARTKADLDKLGQALQRITEEDPSLHVQRDPESGETILSGVGESHLQITVERLRRKFGVDIELGEPQVPFRETITKAAKAEGRHKKQTGGRGQFGDVWVEFEPNPDADFEFVNHIVGGAVPKQYIPAVEKGIQEAMAHGPLAGYPMVNVKATLYDGKYHDVDSSEMAFKIAGSLAYKEGIPRCNPVLLEPIMNVDVVVPENYMGDVIGDLNSKRARILGMEPVGGGKQRVMAHAPLAEMTHYATALRSITQGRGSFSMVLLDYEPMPTNEAQKVIDRARQKQQQPVHV